MKRQERLVVCAVPLVLLVTFVALPTATQAQNQVAYYIVGNERVPLEPSGAYSALKLMPGTSNADLEEFSSLVNAAGVGSIETSPLLQKYGIVLLRVNQGVGPSSFRDGVRSLSESSTIESEVPVFKVGGADQVLVNEFVVQFRSDVAETEITESLEANNVVIVSRDTKIGNRYVVSFPSETAAGALALSNRYSEDDLVVFSEPAFVVVLPERPRIEGGDVGPSSGSSPGPDATPNDPLFPSQWYLKNNGSPGVVGADIKAYKAWDMSHGSSSIVVAILDEGVDTTHPDLKAKIVTPYDATDGDNDQEPNPWDGHGTSCAGIAAAVTGNGKGVAGIGWDVAIMPIRIALSNFNGGPWITTYAIIEDGIRTAVDRGANVLSNSWSGGGGSNLVNSAIDYAISKNRVVVFAAGNASGPVAWPARLSTSKVVLAVSATNAWDEFKTKTSSDPETWWGSCFGPEISVAAPGVHIYTTDISGSAGYASGDYVATFNGTSSATPMVAGTAALILAEKPTWTPSQVRDQIQKTADDKGDPGFDNKFGHGRLNAYKALDSGSTGGPPICSSIGVAATAKTQSAGQRTLFLALLGSCLLLFLAPPLLRRFVVSRSP